MQHKYLGSFVTPKHTANKLNLLDAFLNHLLENTHVRFES